MRTPAALGKHILFFSFSHFFFLRTFRPTTLLFFCSHTPVSFRMNSNPALGNCRSPIGANANISSDYITIPGGVILGNNDAAANVTDIYCNQDLNTTTTITCECKYEAQLWIAQRRDNTDWFFISAAMAGPLYVVVRTDEFTGNGDLASEIGFRFTYAVLNSNCGV